ncbi:MAG: VanW family protein [Agathobacter sp.]|nr:VanW family protein [Agathobacter sp.]
MKKFKFLTMAAMVIVAGAFFLANENCVKADVLDDTIIEEGVYIGGVDVGGMTEEEATAAVNAYVEGLQEQWITLVGPKDSLKYQLKDLELSSKTSVAVKEAVAIGNTGNMLKRFKALQDLEKEDYVVDMGLTIDKQLTGNKIHGKRSKIDIKAIDNGLKKVNGKFEYTAGQAGNEVDIVASVNALNDWIGTNWEEGIVETAEFELTSVESVPRGTEEELAAIKDVLGSHTTRYRDMGSPNRDINIETGTKKINGIVLYPGDEFSFYEYVVPFTAENGYVMDGMFQDGETIMEYGGGICQVVTTLYNAALKAELEITQRFAHSMIIAYAPPGGDAAIAGTYKNLKFKNNYDTPIYIEGYCSDGNVNFNIYGKETRPSNRVVTFESEILSENDPDTEYTLDEKQPIGTYEVKRTEHIGYVARFWKIVTVNGVQESKTQVNKSTYRTSCAKITLGIGNATEEQMATLKKALETKDDDYIKKVVEELAKPVVPEVPDTEATTPDTGTTTPEKPEAGAGDTESSEGSEAGTGVEAPETGASENAETGNDGN